MTDVEHPKMAGSGDGEPGAECSRTVVNSEINKENSGASNNVKKHKRAHSRNKSISGRQDFLEEIANSEFKHPETDTNCDQIEDIKNKEIFTNDVGSSKEKEMLLPEGSDVPDGLRINHNHNGGGHQCPDEIDALPAGLRYNTFDFFCTFLSILTYVVDLVMDCVVAYYFYHLAVDHGIYHYWYFSLTLVFIVLPSLTMTGFSFRWYLMDSDNQQLPPVGAWRWLLRLAILLPTIKSFISGFFIFFVFFVFISSFSVSISFFALFFHHLCPSYLYPFSYHRHLPRLRHPEAHANG